MSWLRRSHKERWAEAAFWFGALMLVAAMSMWATGIIIGAFLPLPFSLAAALHRVWWRIGMALAVWGGWFLALWHILT